MPGMFAGMFKGQYDVSEMSLGELIYYTSRSKAEFVAVPVFRRACFVMALFSSGKFRH